MKKEELKQSLEVNKEESKDVSSEEKKDDSDNKANSNVEEVIQKFINKKMTDSSKMSPDATPNDVPRAGLQIAHAYNDPNDLSPETFEDGASNSSYNNIISEIKSNPADVDTSDSDMEQTIQVLPLFDGYIFSVSSLTGLNIDEGQYTTITSYVISNPAGEVVTVDYFFS